MSLFFIGIGSNVEPEKNVPACLSLLKKTFVLRKISSVYKTLPIGPAGENPFWNLAVQIETRSNREKIGEKLRRVEALLGRRRVPGRKCAPRTIDLDLLPQAGYQRQIFVMIPLAEIAPETIDPETGRTYGMIAGSLEEEARGKIEKLKNIRIFISGRL
jgi:2-amino-4-hydroxy-6-hydroxymethyldihydropteridine diphosphokinase